MMWPACQLSKFVENKSNLIALKPVTWLVHSLQSQSQSKLANLVAHWVLLINLQIYIRLIILNLQPVNTQH